MTNQPSSAFGLNFFCSFFLTGVLTCTLTSTMSACGQPPPPEMEEGTTDDDQTSDDESSTTEEETADADDNTESEGDSGFDELSSYYPMVDGAKWVYQTQNAQSQQGPKEEAQILAEIDPESDKMVYRLTDNEDPDGEVTSSLLVRDGSKAMRVHKNLLVGKDSILMVEYDPGFMRFDDAWAKEEEGFSVELGYTRTASDTPMPEIRRHRYEIFALNEEVEVPAGTFECIKIQRTRLTGASKGERVQSWYAKGVGKVKEHRIDDGKFELLESYEIPG